MTLYRFLMRFSIIYQMILISTWFIILWIAFRNTVAYTACEEEC